MDIDIDQHLCWWGRGRRSRLSGSGRSDGERTPRATPESGAVVAGRRVRAGGGRRAPPERGGVAPARRLRAGDPRRPAGSSAVELPEALGDPGDELGVAL